MKETPVLFSTPMVQGIHEDRKTMTRRTKGLERVNEFPNEWVYRFWAGSPFKGHSNGNGGVDLPRHEFIHKSNSNVVEVKCPYGQVGDILWVRESCCWVMLDHAHDLLEGAKDRTQWVYKSSMHQDWMEYAKEKYGYKWKPSIHMPKEACRIWLKITNIRVERLHDITEQDAIAEGVEKHFTPLFQEWRYKDYFQKDSDWRSAKSSFKSLWQSINGPESWEANPWVWVIEFERSK